MKEIDILIKKNNLQTLDSHKTTQYYYPVFINTKEDFEKELIINDDKISVERAYSIQTNYTDLNVDIIDDKIMFYKKFFKLVYIIDKYQSITDFYNEMLLFAKKKILEEKLKEKNSNNN
jgi:hypothetical protein